RTRSAIARPPIPRSMIRNMESASIALMLVRGLPEQLLPVSHLCFQCADAIEKSREIGNAVGLRGELETGIIELRHEVLDRLGCLRNVLPKHRGSALVGVGDPDRSLEPLATAVKSSGLLSLVFLVASSVICVNGPPKTLRLSVTACAPGSLRPRSVNGCTAICAVMLALP